jgi:MSHA pilin protein MshC
MSLAKIQRHGLLKSFSKGFSLIELVVVILLLTILSVTVLPKFFTSEGFAEYAYQDDVIAKLRLVQTKAMQQTDLTDSDINSDCHSVFLTTSQLATLASCTSADNTSVSIDSSDQVTFSSNFDSDILVFDSMGRPNTCAGGAPCEITITGTGSIVVRIGSEGYIHAI